MRRALRFTKLTSLGLVYMALACCLAPPACADPVPEFLGVYAVVDGRLVELKAHPQSGYMGIEVLGASVLDGLSGISLPFSDKLYFVVYSQGAAQFTALPVVTIARIQYHVSDKGVTYAENAWRPTEKGIRVRIAPLPQNPSMMIRGVPEHALTPGYWGLLVGGALYDFVIGSNPPSECLVREGTTASLMSGEIVRYSDCNQFFAANPRLRRPQPKSASGSPGGGSGGTGSGGTAALVPSAPSPSSLGDPLEACPAAGPARLAIPRTGVRVRTGPSNDSPEITTLAEEAGVSSLGEQQGDYCKVRTPAGEGWVSRFVFRSEPAR